ncbi:hypothetical protein ITJ57_07030 [Plantibacter sp. VKM Ac-2880]|uniref:hypothetical protein n=1 Tax=Plantibacter sp. VKM Ac-2880 TaxID=2783827 RepID=UPI00189086E7|nr:hypothetical protein [Plantibacter sp. VKM Ac-2880]MBF4568522.1 hypothetical protein [Plantibacter sp. VKM Ac-2880]
MAAEVIVHGLGVLIGAPVRQIALIDVPRDMRWRFTPQHSLEGGVAHGSLNLESVIESDDWSTYSSSDNNRERQAHILALWDLCMGGDPQWLHDVTADYTIWSFDHGFWLGGEGDWDLASLSRRATDPWQYDLDAGVASASGLRSAASGVLSLDRAAVHRIVESIPVEWQIPSDELSQVADILYLRVEGVANRLEHAATRSNFA